jgi:uncharacterized protein (DUF3820 family)
MTENMMEDTDQMPFGKHKGKALANVPGDYFLWLYKGDLSKYPKLKAYIEDNMEILKKEAGTK